MEVASRTGNSGQAVKPDAETERR